MRKPFAILLSLVGLAYASDPRSSAQAPETAPPPGAAPAGPEAKLSKAKDALKTKRAEHSKTVKAAGAKTDATKLAALVHVYALRLNRQLYTPCVEACQHFNAGDHAGAALLLRGALTVALDDLKRYADETRAADPRLHDLYTRCEGEFRKTVSLPTDQEQCAPLRTMLNDLRNEHLRGGMANGTLLTRLGGECVIPVLTGTAEFPLATHLLADKLRSQPVRGGAAPVVPTGPCCSPGDAAGSRSVVLARHLRQVLRANCVPEHEIHELLERLRIRDDLDPIK